jgi:hypothetical protein
VLGALWEIIIVVGTGAWGSDVFQCLTVFEKLGVRDTSRDNIVAMSTSPAKSPRDEVSKHVLVQNYR